MAAQTVGFQLCLADFASGAKSLTLALSLAMLRVIRQVVRMVIAIRFALRTHRDLLLEILPCPTS
jgi:hypothetical protein